MAVTTTPGSQVVLAGVGAEEQLSQSTATAAQECLLTTFITNVGMGTATGNINVYNLAAGQPGQMKYLQATATGEAKLILDGATATGRMIFSTAASRGLFIYGATGWKAIHTGTLTTATF
jgi:hypothetical protein